MRMVYSDAIFIGCQFFDNSAGLGGAIMCELSAASQFTDCVFIRNSSQSGGAVLMSEAQPRFTRCTFADNQSLGNGGAMSFSTGAIAVLAKCTLSGNSAANYGGGIFIWDADVRLVNTIIANSPAGESIYTETDSTIALFCCDIYGNAGGDWIGLFADQLGEYGNICADPRFCGAADPDQPYTLWSDSPCADGQSPECGQIGAWAVGCDAAAIAGDGEAPALSSQAGLDLSVRSICVRSVAINYHLPQSATAIDVRLDISDVLGRSIKTLVTEPQSSGEHAVIWDGRGADGRAASAGVYFARLRAGQQDISRSLILIK